jgi:hypothetical protein
LNEKKMHEKNFALLSLHHSVGVILKNKKGDRFVIHRLEENAPLISRRDPMA